MELLNWVFNNYFNMYLNLGLWCGVVMGLLLLLRPVLCRLLTPGQRVFLWGVGWAAGFAPQLFLPLARIPLPVPTLRGLLIPRAERGWPLFLPVMQEAGTYRLVLPGGAAIPFSITREGIETLGWLGLLFLAVTLFLAVYSDRGVKRMARSGTELDREQYRRLLTQGGGLDKEPFRTISLGENSARHCLFFDAIEMIDHCDFLEEVEA